MKIFISHGHDDLAKLRLKDFISSQLGHTPIILGQQTERQGLTIIEALERFSVGCDFAIILLTGDDATADGGRRARQNVIHEVGFFQGRLGRNCVVLIVQRGVEIPSNLAGLFYLEFHTDIQEVFNDLRLMTEANNASVAAIEFSANDWQIKKEKFDRFFPRVQRFLEEIVEFKMKAHELIAGVNEGDNEAGVKAILEYDKLQGKLFARYLTSRNFLEPELLKEIEPVFENLVAASGKRARAENREWLESHMEDAMLDRKDYEEAFDAFVRVISQVFDLQARRLRS